MTNEHINKRFDEELSQINQRIIEMSEIVEAQLVKAVSSFVTGDITDVDKTIKDDKVINKMEVEVDGKVVQLIVKRQPAASDLRFLISVGKALMDLERIGDEAKKIARSARSLTDPDRPLLPLADIQAMADSAVTMLRRAIEAFSHRDAAAAVEICYADVDVNDQFHALAGQLMTLMGKHPDAVAAALETLFVVKSLERIGDHATNIAQYAVYQAYGRDVRHLKAEKIKRRIEKYGGIDISADNPQKNPDNASDMQMSAE